MADSGQGILGINLFAGVAYLGLVAASERPLPEESVKIVPPTHTDEWTGLQGFGDRLLAEAQAKNVRAVVFVEPAKFGGWKYYEAHHRGSLQTAVGLTFLASKIPPRIEVLSLAQKTIAASFGYVSSRQLEPDLREVLGLTSSEILHWKQRGIAFAAALCQMRKGSK